VWKRARSGATDVTIEDLANLPFELQQNRSNPFRSSTEIAFRIPQASWTSLIVYDVQGREVQRLVDRRLEPGAYRETFDARDLPAGVYWVRMQADGFDDAKKMTLLR